MLRSSSTRAIVGMKPLLADVPFRFEPANPGANVTSLQQLCDSVAFSIPERENGTGEQSDGQVLLSFPCLSGTGGGMSERKPLPGAMPGRTPENAPQPADFDPQARRQDAAAGDPRWQLCRRSTATPAIPLPRWSMSRPTRTVRRSSWFRGSPPIPPTSEIDGRASRAAGRDRQGRRAGASAPDRARHLCAGRARLADGQRLRRRFLARHPKSELYADFADFSFWRMAVVSAHLNGGFARAADLTAADVLTDLAGAGRLARRGRERHRTHECRSRRGLPAVCDQIARRAGRRMALRRSRSGRT